MKLFLALVISALGIVAPPDIAKARDIQLLNGLPNGSVMPPTPCYGEPKYDKCYRAKNGKRYSIYGRYVIGTQDSMDLKDCFASNGWVVTGIDAVSRCIGPRNPHDYWPSDY